MNDNLAVVISNDNKEVSFKESVDAAANAGFKNVFIQWYDEESFNPSQEEQLKYIREKNLNVIFAHLGYQNINDIWCDTPEGEALVARYKNDILNCHKNNINLVIMHLTRKKVAPMYNEIGLERLRKICDYAKEINVKVAFENTKIKGYLDYVLDNIQNENVGLCFDAGHYHVHFKDEFNFDKVKNRIFAVHLHDNDQTDDLHLIPYDGTNDWEKVVKNLKFANYNGPITLEIVYRYDYLNHSIEEFYKKGYEAGLKLNSLFNDK